MDAVETRSSIEIVEHLLRFQGNGTGVPTKTYGKGMTVTRTSAGLYKVTWAAFPGFYVDFSPSLMAATPGDLAGHQIIADTYDATTKSMEFRLSNAADAAHDLEANEWIGLTIRFSPKVAA